MKNSIFLTLAILLAACQAQHTNTLSNNTAPALEVIGVFRDKGTDSISLIHIEKPNRFSQLHTTLNPKKHGKLVVGERVKISGIYHDNRIQKIHNITHVDNPDKAQCEATQGNRWQPQGMAQIPTCITTYTDAGKACTTSQQCKGDCIVTHPDKPAVCAASSSHFGCRSRIEDFQQHGGILCVD